ncbi:MAG: ATP synthase subunit I [Clostridia bacterium]|nr:ATP synthase subunit I [Clostridia bacterium]
MDPTVLKETCYIAGFVLVFSAVMQLIFALLGSWSFSVLWGNLLGGTGAVLNFFLMGLTIQQALGQSEEDAKTKMKLSQKLRMLLLVIVCAIGAAAPCFDLVAVLVPQLFPRIAVMLRPVLDKLIGRKAE